MSTTPTPTQPYDGGPAFPVTASTGDPRDGVYCRDGMTLRDWFAGKALSGILADPNSDGSYKGVAESAYGFADAMLAAREVKP